MILSFPVDQRVLTLADFFWLNNVSNKMEIIQFTELWFRCVIIFVIMFVVLMRLSTMWMKNKFLNWDLLVCRDFRMNFFLNLCKQLLLSAYAWWIKCDCLCIFNDVPSDQRFWLIIRSDIFNLPRVCRNSFIKWLDVLWLSWPK